MMVFVLMAVLLFSFLLGKLEFRKNSEGGFVPEFVVPKNFLLAHFYEIAVIRYSLLINSNKSV